MTPERHFQHEPEPAPASPLLPFLEEAEAGHELMLSEHDGSRLRAVVIAREPFAVVIGCRAPSGEAQTRAFGMNGWEFGTETPALLAPMPPHQRERLRRRELYRHFQELLSLYGEDTLPLDALAEAIHEARSHARARLTRRNANLRTLTIARNRPEAQKSLF